MIEGLEPSGPSASPQSLKWRIAIVVVCVNLFVVFLAVSSLRQSWIQYQERAETTTRNLSRVLDEEIGGDIEKIDVTLLAAGEEVTRQIGSGGIDAKQLNAYLSRQQQRLPEIHSLRVTNERGTVVYGTGVTSGLVNVSDRNYFASQREDPNAGLIIDPPVLARISKQWSIPISRRIDRPDGALAGVVYVNLSIDHLVKTFATLDLGGNGIANLRDINLNVMARYPERQGMGSTIGKPTISPPLRQLIEAGQSSGTYRARAVLDNIERTYSYRKIDGYPLYVTVGLAADDYLAEWRASVVKLGAWTLLFFVATLLTSGLIYRALTRQRLAAEQLSLSAKVFEGSGECIVITDHEERIVSINKAFAEVTGYLAAEVLGKTPRLMNSGRQDAAFYREMWQTIEEAGYWCGEIWDRRKSGEIYPKWLSISAVKDAQNRVTHYIGIFSDITERKKAEAQIEFLAFHDALTELPNRLLARDHLEMAIAYAERAGSRTAVLFLDLDNFKTINDSFGHGTGDALLIAVAQRLRGCTRETDTISRQGGDEFLIVLSDVADADAITSVTEKILGELEQTFDIGGKEISTSLSIGVAVYPDDSEDIDTLLQLADTAMYHAKEAGRNAYRFYTEQMNVDAVAHQRIRVGLRRALERGEFVLHYQPQMDLASGAVVGAEALIRWNHPELGLLPPASFIPIAEESGLIVPMGDWVLREACRQGAEWRRAGGPELVMAVNISALQFKRGDLERSVLEALAESGLPPALLELELTESILIRDTDKVLETVQRLKSHGLMLSIDDFGTGYSSLAYLKRFNVDKLKIDRSFVCDMVRNPNDAIIVRAIIQMARNLNLKTIAEGVEDEHLLSFLRLQYCDEAQGYYFSRPLPADEFARFVAANARKMADAAIVLT